MKIKEIEIDDWKSLIRLQKPATLYRGQSDAAWDLSSSLERACLAIDGNLDAARRRERSLRKLFKRHYHDYSQDIPEPDDDLRWLALMQHYGAPTRLMDWTTSVLVAAYFAMEKGEKRAAIWELELEPLRESSKQYLEKQGIDSVSLSVARGRVSREDAKARFSELYLSNAYQFVRSMTPYYLDRRIVAQQGVFVCQGDVSSPFMENLEALNLGKGVLTKYTIKKSFQRDFLYRLYAANIGRFTLFPGLDGFSQSLNIFHPTAWEGKKKGKKKGK